MHLALHQYRWYVCTNVFRKQSSTSTPTRNKGVGGLRSLLALVCRPAACSRFRRVAPAVCP